MHTFFFNTKTKSTDVRAKSGLLKFSL